jgi:hypothetical protein
MRHNHYGINFDYAHRREFHRTFWDALRTQFRQSTAATPQTRTPCKAAY